MKTPKGWKKVKDTPNLVTYTKRRIAPIGFVGYTGVISLKKYSGRIWNMEVAIRDTRGEMWEDYEKQIALSKKVAIREAYKLMRKYTK